MSTINYPYFTAVYIDSGQMVKMFRDKKFKTFLECAEAIRKRSINHPNIWNDRQIAILEYTNTYQSRIRSIWTNGVCTKIKLEKIELEKND
jgi:hypothetical protein